MDATAIVAPILPGKLDEWRAFSRDLHEGLRHSDFTAFMKKCGVSRIRCWGQEGSESAMAIILYEGETPAEFMQQMKTSQEPFAVWSREGSRNATASTLQGPWDRHQSW
ncbi:hypothetical protein KAV67_04685 [Candidatus Bipolaricaulota bacterium]|nr:hypothetical protein [Candidatus Bipolaricaulota bacterium]